MFTNILCTLTLMAATTQSAARSLLDCIDLERARPDVEI